MPRDGCFYPTRRIEDLILELIYVTMSRIFCGRPIHSLITLDTMKDGLASACVQMSLQWYESLHASYCKLHLGYCNACLCLKPGGYGLHAFVVPRVVGSCSLNEWLGWLNKPATAASRPFEEVLAESQIRPQSSRKRPVP